jgi:hypothetical protein
MLGVSGAYGANTEMVSGILGQLGGSIWYLDER